MKKEVKLAKIVTFFISLVAVVSVTFFVTNLVFAASWQAPNEDPPEGNPPGFIYGYDEVDEGPQDVNMNISGKAKSNIIEVNNAVVNQDIIVKEDICFDDNSDDNCIDSWDDIDGGGESLWEINTGQGFLYPINAPDINRTARIFNSGVIQSFNNSDWIELLVEPYSANKTNAIIRWGDDKGDPNGPDRLRFQFYDINADTVNDVMGLDYNSLGTGLTLFRTDGLWNYFNLPTPVYNAGAGSNRNNSVWQFGLFSGNTSAASDHFYIGRSGISMGDLAVFRSGDVGIGLSETINSIADPQADLHISNNLDDSGTYRYDSIAGYITSLRLEELTGTYDTIWELRSHDVGGDGMGANFSIWGGDPARGGLADRLVLWRDGKLFTTNDLRVGKVTEDDGSTAGYGNRIYISGGDDWSGWDSDNSDPLWIGRYNLANNQSQLRINIGDDSVDPYIDELQIGMHWSGDGLWRDFMTIESNGRVGIGVINPRSALDIHHDLCLTAGGMSECGLTVDQLKSQTIPSPMTATRPFRSSGVPQVLLDDGPDGAIRMELLGDEASGLIAFTNPNSRFSEINGQLGLWLIDSANPGGTAAFSVFTNRANDWYGKVFLGGNGVSDQYRDDSRVTISPPVADVIPNETEEPLLVLDSRNGGDQGSGSSLQFRNNGAGYLAAIAGLDYGSNDVYPNPQRQIEFRAGTTAGSPDTVPLDKNDTVMTLDNWGNLKLRDKYSGAGGGQFMTCDASGNNCTAVGGSGGNNIWFPGTGSDSASFYDLMDVTGANSIGIKLDQTKILYTVSEPNTMAIMDGKVGIGTLTPRARLDVVGRAVFNSNPDNGGGNVEIESYYNNPSSPPNGVGSGMAGGIRVNQYYDASSETMRYTRTGPAGTIEMKEWGDWSFGNAPFGTVGNVSNNVTGLTIKNDGRVGIRTTGNNWGDGTKMLDAALTVWKPTGGSAIDIYGSDSAAYDYSGIRIGDGGLGFGTGNKHWGIWQRSGNTPGIAERNDFRINYYNGSSYSERLTIDAATGNIGLTGATNPQSELQIYTGPQAGKSTYSTANNGNWEGLNINSYWDTADYNYGIVDLVAGRYTNSSSGGSMFRFFTQPRTGSTGAVPPALSMIIDKDGKVGARQYCDINGANCKTITEMGGGNIWTDAGTYIYNPDNTLRIYDNGFISNSGNSTITLDPPSPAQNNVGWKMSLWGPNYALGVANYTLALKTGTWVSMFDGNPANNGTATTFDTNSYNAFSRSKNYFAGNVGIGVTNPVAKLEVAGQIKITGGSPGAGKVLTSDANGLATWQASSSGMGGSGTANYLAKFTGASTIGNSTIFDNGTNVGIGTTLPTAKLDVVGLGGSTVDLKVSGRIMSNSSSGGMWLSNSNDGFVGNNGTNIGFWTNGVAWNAFQINKSTGNVGIGTAAPASKLDVAGVTTLGSGGNSDYVMIRRQNSTAEGGELRLQDYNASGNWTIDNYQNNLRLISSGNRTVQIGGVPAFGIYNNLDVGAGDLYVNDQAGTVGIGTNAPTEKLDVNGNVRVRGTLDLDIVPKTCDSGTVRTTCECPTGYIILSGGGQCYDSLTPRMYENYPNSDNTKWTTACWLGEKAWVQIYCVRIN